ncbi:MAG: N-acetyltransferase [Clostridiales bacterium]|nr:N-acetyltransferase [Clostridiales bacterium]
MRLEIRRAAEEDFRAVEEVTREAFWNLHVPGCDEHYLVHALREHPDFLPELDFVAVHGAEIVGSILYSRSRVEDVPTITFGPVSVLPVYQRMGVGSALIRHTLSLAKELGHRAVLIYGSPHYYPRFGFQPGKRFEIRTSDNMYAAALQALELYPGALKGVSGRFFESDAFEVDVRASEAFDKGFPRRERKATDAQKEFQKIASMREPYRG